MQKYNNFCRFSRFWVKGGYILTTCFHSYKYAEMTPVVCFGIIKLAAIEILPIALLSL